MPEAERITRALGGQWQRGRGIAPCPICQQERRSDQRALSITQGRSRTLFHCHKTGCDVFGEVRRRGILDERPARPERRSEPLAPPVEDRARLQRLWRSANPITGTLAERYLRRRGIDLEGRDVETLRFHPALYYDPHTRLPGLLAAVTDGEGELQGVHRTFLAADGSDKADVTPNRRMLGRMTGGVVRLGPPGPVIALAEGLETALTVWTRSGIPCWSALSAAGTRGFDLEQLPPNAALLIAADHDETGWLAALGLLIRARQASRTAAIVMPKRAGRDFNDLVRPQSEPRHLLPA